ncbi:saccharopine dehydrogenase NAD+ L-lysine forming protein [Halorhabdus tiamatea SARL4B]|uniref:Saccharopine dehydrogenase n=1 Tax=Halorhabdus tiamatea SARL4B TaxID=1033806 RepID=F7PKN0_9EURY|nr:saccharopine dehydrogenase NADP-binding domain-containing protein [Halorhabdus tiamatea]ERJ05951.1 saccharopine dehydrogenase NAD+ L-lysine forming protein [Halorhabdus tiamatea SARL4B]CCQ34015.1 saccharopine dehydrogenase [Halorhabdus tiamatea SARL4B]
MAVLIYGAYGYSGELVAREAADRDLDVVLAGRNGTKTRGLAIQLGVDARVFPVEEAERHLDGVDVVLNCAGPFVETAEAMAEACLATGTHYLDITGEIAVFESLVERDREAEDADVCLLPGVGFDVVPTDCLAAHLHDRLPTGTHLRLGIDTPGSVSGGTLATALEQAGAGGMGRRDGRLRPEAPGAKTRTIDFGSGPEHAVSAPMGDVSTAYYTTGIENVEVYLSAPEYTEHLLRASGYVTPLLAVPGVKNGLQALVRALVSGPSADARERERVRLWGEATDGETTVTSRLETPETYALTVDAATTALERIEAGADITGYQTPATAFGPEYVLELDGVDGFLDE